MPQMPEVGGNNYSGITASGSTRGHFGDVKAETYNRTMPHSPTHIASPLTLYVQITPHTRNRNQSSTTNRKSSETLNSFERRNSVMGAVSSYSSLQGRTLIIPRTET